MENRFLCDATVCKLSRHLRFLGIDTSCTSEYEPYRVIEIGNKENRIILTRNRKFLKFENKNIYVLKSDFVFEQLREVIENFNIKNPKLFTRCSKCNSVLIDIKKEKVRGKVPYYTYKHFNEFKFCPVCNKMYWRGTHIDLMIKRLKKEGIWELLF